MVSKPKLTRSSKSPQRGGGIAKKSPPPKTASGEDLVPPNPKSKIKGKAVKAATKHKSSDGRPSKKETGKLNLLQPAAIEKLFETFESAEPAPKGELLHTNPFTLLVAVVLSAQATDAGVNKATRELFRLADTPAKMVALGEERVRELVRTIGLFRTKARNVVLLSQMLIDDFGGAVPQDRDTLELLPGVGRKTANVVMNVAFGEPTMAVDTHVLRISNRIGLSAGKTPLAVEEDLLACVPARYGVHAHHWLILHGRYVCKARKPECGVCLVRHICLFPDKVAPSR